jgi:hypothetical protein
MFIGHFALALAAKPLARRRSLGTMMMAAEWVDLVWPVMLLLGWETVTITSNSNPFLVLDFTGYPWTHSLAMGIAWALLLGLVTRKLTGDARGGTVVGALVLSHWFLDFASHRPDMPLWPGGPRVGLGLWNSVVATVVVEGLLFVAGVVIYLRSTRARDRIGSVALWALLLFLAGTYALNLKGTPPPSVKALAFTALALWLVPLWAWWADRHREVVPVEHER